MLWTPIRKATAALVGLLIGSGSGFVGYKVVQSIDRPHSCAPGVQWRGTLHECVGVSAGGSLYAFDPGFADIEREIGAQNKVAAARPRHVSIALLMPLTDSGIGAVLLHSLQGFAAAQRGQNEDPARPDPAIQLILANDGTGDAQWQPVVHRLAQMTGAPFNLRAVTGFLRSTSASKGAVSELSGDGIPTLGDTISADDLANNAKDTYRNLVRIASTNSDQAAALAYFSAIDPKRTMLVEEDPTNNPDDYVTTLAAAFQRRLSGTQYQPLVYPSPATDPNVAVQFENWVQTLCATKARTILFAGRYAELSKLIEAIGTRGCTDRSFTILTGDDASYLTSHLTAATPMPPGVTVDYGADAYPGSAMSVPASAGDSWQTGYQNFVSELAAMGIPSSAGELADGSAIMAHDAGLTATTAIEQASLSGGIPSLVEVADEWRQLNGVHKVVGASGWICLDNYGNPYDKPVPIVTIEAHGSTSLAGVTWPTGSAQTEPCVPPPNG